jgi:hypothetical protein
MKKFIIASLCVFIAATIAYAQVAVSPATISAGIIIGKVTTDQTLHGTTDLVAADITKVGGTALALGQAAMVASVPVALANNQTTLPVSIAATVPVSIATAPVLVAGANTIGKVDILGNSGATLDGPAGTAATQALTVQGVAGMTKLLVTPDAITIPAGANTIGNVKLVDTGGTNQAAIKAASTAAVATDTALVVAISPNNLLDRTGPATTAASVPIVLSSEYPVNNVTTTPTAITGNAVGTTAAVVGTLAAAASKTTFICGFNISALGGTATVGPVTVAGLIGSSQIYRVPINVTTGSILVAQNFSPCLPASAVNTAITITTTANATATAVDVNSWGYQL